VDGWGIKRRGGENTGLALCGRHLEVQRRRRVSWWWRVEGGGAGCSALPRCAVDENILSRAKTRKFAIVASFS
jgi:hypothetical protein